MTTIVPRPETSRKKKEALNKAKETAREQALLNFSKAKAHHADNRIPEALDHYLKATIYDPNYFQAYCNMGTCYRSLNKYCEAKNCYYRALKLKDSDAITHYNLANLFRVIGDYQRSIKHYEVVINAKEKQNKQVGTLYEDSLINLGICYKNEGLLEEAIAIYEKVDRMIGEDESSLYNHAMCLLALIESSPSRSFAILNEERGRKMKSLLAKVEKLSPDNRMTRVAKIKLDVLLVQTKKRACEAIEQLKTLLSDEKYNGVLNQVKEAIHFCQDIDSFLQKASKTEAFLQRSRPGSSNSIDSLLQGFVLSPLPDIPAKSSITEREAIRLIQNHNYKEVEDRLKTVGGNELLKNSIQLMLYKSKAEVNSNYLGKAFELYERYFQKAFNKGELLFEDLSLETHKTIGFILNSKRLYAESARHFEFVSTSIKTDVIASDHSIVGEGLQSAGNLEKALQEYRTAFELQPSNEAMSYNLGCCLLECGYYDEAIKYFNVFLTLLQTKSDISEEEKEEYRTECSIFIALSSSGKPNELELYKAAFRKLLKLRNQLGQTELEEQNMLTFFANFTDLAENTLRDLDLLSKDYVETRELLITLYENLLNFSQCPDKDEILLNAGNFSYESGLFLKAVSFYHNISTTLLIPLRKMALCYLQLFEPAMIFKYLEEDEKINSNSPVSVFTGEVVNWIYSNERKGRFGSQLPKVREDLFYERNLFGVGLISKLDLKLKDSEMEEKEVVQKYIVELLGDASVPKLTDPQENIKFMKIKQLLQLSQDISTSITSDYRIPAQVIRVCFNKSEDILKDLSLLNAFFLKMPNQGVQGEIMEALIFLFCYHNHSERQTILDVFHREVTKQISLISLNLDKVIEIDESQLSILPDFSSSKKLVALMREWEELLEPQTQQIVRLIEKEYYEGDVGEALEVCYNFPRHIHFHQCDQTFSKFHRLMKIIMPEEQQIVYKGQTILEMKKDLKNCYESSFNQYIKRNKIPPLALSQQLTPVTIHCTHPSKEHTDTFIASLLKLTSHYYFQPIKCQEYQIVINNLLTLKCSWGDSMANTTILSQVLQNITESQMDLVEQSVINLPKLLGVLRDWSDEVDKLIKLDSTLNF